MKINLYLVFIVLKTISAKHSMVDNSYAINFELSSDKEKFNENFTMIEPTGPISTGSIHS